MKSIKELYRIGTGPSSSHTMGPRKAAEMFVTRHPDAAKFKVTLYGSLAATGKGHMTDVAIIDTLEPTAPVEIIWQPKVFLPFHPNGMTFAAFDTDDKLIENWTVYSIGGGALAENSDTPSIESRDVYGMNSMTEILEWCERSGKGYWEYVKECEDSDIWDYLNEVWKTMIDSIRRGLEEEGVLPGPLNLRRKASTYYIRATGYKQSLQSRGLVFAYALLKGCRMKAVLTEKYEDAALAIYEKYSDVSEKDAAEFALCYSEVVRNRDYQDYGRKNEPY